MTYMRDSTGERLDEMRVSRQRDRLGYHNRPTKVVPEFPRYWRRTSSGNAIVPYVAGDWKSTQSGVGLDVVWDHQRGLYAMVYSGDNHSGSTGHSRLGITFTNDLDDWYSWRYYSGLNPSYFFSENAASDQPDSGGVTFPQLVWDDATELWHMFYIAFPSAGFEVGQSTVCVATCPTLSKTDSDWTRHGVMVDPDNVPWIATEATSEGATAVMYRPTVVELDDGSYGMFFNGGTYGKESIGYATADSLLGPWTPRSTPVVDRLTIAPTNESGVVVPINTTSPGLSDPDVFRVGSQWYMMIWTGGPIRTLIGTTSAANFPVGWTFRDFNLNEMRTVLVNGPRGPRMFAWDRVLNGQYGPISLRPQAGHLPPHSVNIMWDQSAQAATTGGQSWGQFLDTTKPYGGVLYSNAASPGNQNAELTFWREMQNGAYFFRLMHVKGPARGQYAIYLNDDTSPVNGVLIDGYHATEGTVATDGFTINANPPEGLTKIRIKMVSKNASSTGYQGAIIRLAMDRTSK